LLVGGFENVFQLYRGVTERDLYVMLLLFAFLVFRPGGLFSRN
jgi:branched-chain amino acid transport system permease protein